eukprot:2149274-Prymnesium_polylepis.1
MPERGRPGSSGARSLALQLVCRVHARLAVLDELREEEGKGAQPDLRVRSNAMGRDERAAQAGGAARRVDAPQSCHAAAADRGRAA